MSGVTEAMYPLAHDTSFPNAVTSAWYTPETGLRQQWQQYWKLKGRTPSPAWLRGLTANVHLAWSLVWFWFYYNLNWQPLAPLSEVHCSRSGTPWRAAVWRRWDVNIKVPVSKCLGVENKTQTQEPRVGFSTLKDAKYQICIIYAWS